MQRSVTAEADLVAHALAPSQRADPVNGERQRERARAVLARLDTVRQVLRERALAARSETRDRRHADPVANDCRPSSGALPLSCRSLGRTGSA